MPTAAGRVFIIGAGVVGASAAYHLAAAGVDVVVVDRAEPGQATQAGAGVVFPWPLPGEPPAWAALCAVADAHWARLPDALAAEGFPTTGYARVGGISVVDEGAGVESLYEGTQQLKAMTARGLGDIRLLGPGEARALFPPLRAGLAGVHAAGISRVDGRMLRDALVGAARRHGATEIAGSASLTTSDGEVTGVEVDGERHAADAVIVAAGAWTAELCRPLGIEVPVYPMRGQLLHFDLPGVDTTTMPVVQTSTGFYFLAFPGGRIVAGSTREDVGFDLRTTAGGVHELLVQALDFAPGLSDATLVEVRVGFRPASRDTLPFIGPVDGVGGLIIATGLGPSGLTLGPATGSIVADLAMAKPPALDVAPYQPDRRIES
jgi:D-amino-acid dehydrogenase